MKEYSLKFVKLSKYASSLVSNRRVGVSEDLEEESRVAMLHDNMYLARFIEHEQ